MTDKEYRTTRNRIIKIFSVWSMRVGMRHWAVSCSFTREEQSNRTAAFVNVDWEYKSARITFHCSPLLSHNDKELTAIVVHELVHILVNEMREWCQTAKLPDEDTARSMKHEERVTTMITDALIWTYNDGVTDGKKGIDGKNRKQKANK